MTIITIESKHNKYGYSQHCYMADYIDWPALLKAIKDDEQTKYWIRTLIV